MRLKFNANTYKFEYLPYYRDYTEKELKKEYFEKLLQHTFRFGIYVLLYIGRFYAFTKIFGFKEQEYLFVVGRLYTALLFFTLGLHFFTIIQILLEIRGPYVKYLAPSGFFFVSFF
uniref:Uncharacterized protein n=1 Tax=Panagrolaimus sp. ES5 TaxID=591445 RepID=A0AC34G7X0_9BILA